VKPKKMLPATLTGEDSDEFVGELSVEPESGAALIPLEQNN
jgi:hypothetical protein